MDCFKNLLSFISDLISIQDANMNIIFSNWQGFGAVPTEKRILNTKCYKTYRGYDSMCPDCKMPVVLSSKKEFQGEIKLPDGIWLDIRLIPILDDENNVEAVVKWVRDITARKKIEAEREQISAEYQKVFQSSQDHMFLIEVVDQDTFRFIRNNKAHARATGFDTQKLRGKTPEELLGAELGSIIKNNYKKCLTEQKPISYQETLSLPGGTRTWSTFLTPVVEAGQISYIVGSSRDITVSKKAERDKLNLLENSPDMIVRFDTSLQHIYCNKAVEVFWGIPRAFFLGKSLTELSQALAITAENTIKSLEDKLNNCLKTEQEQYLDFWFTNKGATKHFSIRIVPELNNVEEVESILAVSRDTTEQKNAENKLKKSEQRYRTIFDFSPVGILIADDKGTILEVNKAICEITGYSKAELEGNSILKSLVLPEDIAEAKEHISEIINGKDMKFITKTKNVQGKTKYTQLHETRIALPDGAKGILSMQIDFTSRVMAEKALQKSEESHRRLFETMEQGVIYQNRKGEITSVNPAAERILGLSFAEMKAKPSSDSYWQMIKEDGSAVKGFDHPAMIALRTGKKIGPVVRGVYHDKKNSHVWLNITAIPLFQQGEKNPFQVYATFTDITEFKAATERIRYISFHDSLTGLYNRRYIEEEMKRLNTKRQLPISVVMIDLNGLKLINDTYGHQKGDEMLKSLANILKESCRQEDLIARWGGDEFIILFPQTNLKIVNSICQRINNACQRRKVGFLPLSIAIGTAQKDTMNKTLDKTLNEAEDNMYKNKLAESRSARSSVLNALLKVLAAKSFETEAHSLKMKEIALQIGERLNLPKTELDRLSLLTTLHDIGKVNISEEILTKKDSLTKEEWVIIKKHPEIGYRIARATEEFAHVAEDILAHHEHWDGSGYPRGLKETAIPLLARICAVADAYEVMSSGRPYKKAMTKAEIIAEFKNRAGTQFDPELVAIFLSILS